MEGTGSKSDFSHLKYSSGWATELLLNSYCNLSDTNVFHLLVESNEVCLHLELLFRCQTAAHEPAARSCRFGTFQSRQANSGMCHSILTLEPELLTKRSDPVL